MKYETFLPRCDLDALVKCYWTLEVPAGSNSQKQRIIPDGCIEMAFILGDDIKRFTSETDFILQPRAMVLGQTIEPFYIQPVGYVNTFAIRFYPYGFSNFVSTPINDLANRETPIAQFFDETTASELERNIVDAANVQQRIEIVETFLSNKLNDQATIDNLVKSTVDALFSTSGSVPIIDILKEDPSKRRQLERRFLNQIGISPKQLGKVLRLQTALSLLLSQKAETLTKIAYESAYYDQAHFIRDFKEFTGISPKSFLNDERMALSALFYTGD